MTQNTLIFNFSVILALGISRYKVINITILDYIISVLHFKSRVIVAFVFE